MRTQPNRTYVLIQFNYIPTFRILQIIISGEKNPEGTLLLMYTHPKQDKFNNLQTLRFTKVAPQNLGKFPVQPYHISQLQRSVNPGQHHTTAISETGPYFILYFLLGYFIS
jgi:hypothetical protein